MSAEERERSRQRSSRCCRDRCSCVRTPTPPAQPLPLVRQPIRRRRRSVHTLDTGWRQAHRFSASFWSSSPVSLLHALLACLPACLPVPSCARVLSASLPLLIDRLLQRERDHQLACLSIRRTAARFNRCNDLRDELVMTTPLTGDSLSLSLSLPDCCCCCCYRCWCCCHILRASLSLHSTHSLSSH